MAAVTVSTPDPRPTDPPFRLTVRDIFTIEGLGTVVCGQVESGTIRVGDKVQLTRPGFTRKLVVVALESFRKSLTQAWTGDEVGMVMRGLRREDVQEGDVLIGPGS